MGSPQQNKYQDVWYTSSDGLRLYARDYNNISADVEQAPAILCLHGLTRNSADFDDICAALEGRYRLIVADQRGRGRSQYDPQPDNYNPLVYVQDMVLLLETLRIASVILMGTSMGGIMAMLMALQKPALVKALIVNDIGPEVAKQGLDRIKSYVGKSVPVRNWDEAVAQTIATNGIAFPDFTDQDWLAFAKRVYWEDQSGCPVLAYDQNLLPPAADGDTESLAPNLWPIFEQIADKPMLSLRGELSDVFDAQCLAAMQQKKPDLQSVEIPNVGHAPLLNEAAARAAIEAFLKSVSLL